jgi:hypothetical protein
MPEYVVIRPRNGVEAKRIKRWLESNFQSLANPLNPDSGQGAEAIHVPIRGGNPLINADVRIVKMP